MRLLSQMKAGAEMTLTEAESKIDRLVQLLSGNVHFVAGQVTLIGKIHIDLVAISKFLFGGNTFCNLRAFESAEMFERVNHLFAFHTKLFGIIQMLPFASAANAKVFTARLRTAVGKLDHLRQTCNEKAALDLRDPRLHRVADRRRPFDKNLNAVLKLSHAAIFVGCIENLDLNRLFLFEVIHLL